MKVALADFDEPNLQKAEQTLLKAGVPRENVFIHKTGMSLPVSRIQADVSGRCIELGTDESAG